MRDPNCTDPTLAVTALRYAAGDMTPADAEMFEARLADDQQARDALAEAVRLSAAASGLPDPAPDPLLRVAVAERLNPTWVTRLFPRRPYRGHPAAWAGLGGAVAAMLVVAMAMNSTPDVVYPTAFAPPPSHPPIVATIEPVSPADSNTATRAPVLPLPAHPKLNPMGMDPQPGDCTVATGPMAVPTPMAMPTPTPLPSSPAAKPTGNSIAECPNEHEPMAEPMIGGMIISRL